MPIPITLRERAAAIAAAPWAYAAADVTALIDELVASLPEEKPMDYQDALHIVKYPQLNDPLTVDKAFTTLEQLDPTTKAAQQGIPNWAVTWIILGVCTAIFLGLLP